MMRWRRRRNTKNWRMRTWVRASRSSASPLRSDSSKTITETTWRTWCNGGWGTRACRLHNACVPFLILWFRLLVCCLMRWVCAYVRELSDNWNVRSCEEFMCYLSNWMTFGGEEIVLSAKCFWFVGLI